MEKKLLLELNALKARPYSNLEDWEIERMEYLEEQLLEIQDMTYEALLEINE